MPDTHSIRVVVIDDEYFNRGLVKLLIEKHAPDFVVVAEADNMRDGLRLLETVTPDVVFIDIKMPDGSGLDLIRDLQGKKPHVVFVTGFDEFREKARGLKALDYLLKPIDSDKLLVTLDRIRDEFTASNRQPGS